MTITHAQDDYIMEMCRFGAGELHVVAAFIGGMAAQVGLLLRAFVEQGFHGVNHTDKSFSKPGPVPKPGLLAIGLLIQLYQHPAISHTPALPASTTVCSFYMKCLPAFKQRTSAVKSQALENQAESSSSSSRSTAFIPGMTFLVQPMLFI
eukprot:1003627-Pelagomonas_calceolata.AAC.4